MHMDVGQVQLFSICHIPVCRPFLWGVGRGRFVDDGDDFENADASWITANNDDRRSRYLGIKEILVVVSKKYLPTVYVGDSRCTC